MCERYTKEAINSIYRERDQSKECTKLEKCTESVLGNKTRRNKKK